ncbi:hypothetical protein QBA35_35320 [Streptomyces bottropensis]|uniref:Uncharacterized protein n=1 Tax=Streptomyces bottropensis TaxID=42235 RepID=A0ABU8AXV1_9ACTN
MFIDLEDGDLPVGEQRGDRLDDVTHMLTATVVAGRGSPVLQVSELD